MATTNSHEKLESKFKVGILFSQPRLFDMHKPLLYLIGSTVMDIAYFEYR